MCVIINIENGDFPQLATLKSAELLNSHGGSIAWVENNKINYQKGINAKTINKIIEDRLKPNNVKIAIIHFRIASVGNVNKKLCHPFQISNKVNLDLIVEDSKYDLLFHNGTITNWQNILIKFMQGNKLRIPKGELSDSRIMAFLINHNGHEFLKKLAENNKFSILTKNGIIKYGKWVKVDNVECSNNYFINNFNYYDNNWWQKSKYNKNAIIKSDKLDQLEEKYDLIADKVNQKSDYSLSKNYQVVKHDYFGDLSLKSRPYQERFNDWDY